VSGRTSRSCALTGGEPLALAVADARPAAVMHLAAEIASQRSERKLQDVNVHGTGRLLDACTALSGGDPAGGPRIVFCSTVSRATREERCSPRRSSCRCTRPTGAPSRGNAVDAVVRSARSSNAKIKRELGWRPLFPTARDGVTDAVARMQAA
jgi:nucleoside-diphosphate-sugar epimerase